MMDLLRKIRRTCADDAYYMYIGDRLFLGKRERESYLRNIQSIYIYNVQIARLSLSIFLSFSSFFLSFFLSFRPSPLLSWPIGRSVRKGHHLSAGARAPPSTKNRPAGPNLIRRNHIFLLCRPLSLFTILRTAVTDRAKKKIQNNVSSYFASLVFKT